MNDRLGEINDLAKQIFANIIAKSNDFDRQTVLKAAIDSFYAAEMFYEYENTRKNTK